MQIKLLQQKILKESIVGLLALLLLGGLYFGLMTLSQEYTNEISTLERTTNETIARTNLYRDQFVKVQKNMALYREALDQILSKTLLIEDYNSARIKLEELKARYLLGGKMPLLMGSPEYIKGTEYKEMQEVISKRNVSLTMSALTDEDIFGFVNALYHEMPGMVQITGFSISRASLLTDQGLRSIVETGEHPLVSAEIKFNWFGIRDLGDVPSAPAVKDVQ